MMSNILSRILRIVLLIALGLGLRAARPALAMPEVTLAKRNLVTWRGGADNYWSNPANWQDGTVPRPYDIVRFPSDAPDALVDSSFHGIVGGIHMEAGYRSGVTLARSLTVLGDVQLAGAS